MRGEGGGINTVASRPICGASQVSGGQFGHGQLGSFQTLEGLDRVGILLHHLVVEQTRLQCCKRRKCLWLLVEFYIYETIEI